MKYAAMTSLSLEGKSILLVISGGIAAYKALDLVRLLKKAGAELRCILTAGGAQFITPLAVSALSGTETYTDLWSLKDETEMGHIRLSREADLIVVAPASANMMAKMAHGLADDLATTTILASDKPVMIAPAMNPIMWQNPATQDNLAILEQRGFLRIGPDRGEMACGEHGEGRMAEPAEIFGAIAATLLREQPLRGRKALVTSGPTYEPLDPVRFIGNRSSGKQGHAIACALRDAGAEVTLVSGPVALPDPPGMNVIHVETAIAMLNACQDSLPADIAVCAAAVSDWSATAIMKQKIKKRQNAMPPALSLKENPDILAMLARPSPRRPSLVIGFAAETDDLIAKAQEKLARKGCDFLLANQVGPTENGDEKVFGQDENHVYLVARDGHQDWGHAPKDMIARKLCREIAKRMEENHDQQRQRA